MSVRGLGRLIKLPYSAEKRRARANEDGGGFGDGVEGVNAVACDALAFVAQVQESQAGWIARAVGSALHRLW